MKIRQLENEPNKKQRKRKSMANDRRLALNTSNTELMLNIELKTKQLLANRNIYPEKVKM